MDDNNCDQGFRSGGRGGRAVFQHADPNSMKTDNIENYKNQRGGRGRGGRGRGRGGNYNRQNRSNENYQVRPQEILPEKEIILQTEDNSITFESFNLAPEIMKALKDCGYMSPTPIQQRAIPPALKGQDILAGAQTGTGKTAAFALPVLHQLSMNIEKGSSTKGATKVLVLTPTRELAAQVGESFSQYATYLPDIKSTVIFGGVGQGPQVTALSQRPCIVVATPGRLLDLANQGVIEFSGLQFFILDEADRMLDMGFFPDVSKVIKMLPQNTHRQTLLFSATFPSDIRSLANSILKQPIAEVQVTPPNSTVERINQKYYMVGRDFKKEALLHIITSNKWNQVLVFVRTKHHANSVADYLNKHGAPHITALPIHGGKSQTSRTTALSNFKNGTLTCLVATDIAARGIDIEDLPHVVNYEIPNVAEDYVHRIGRTGRAGKQGHAVSLVSLDEEGFMINIKKFSKAEIPLDSNLPEQFATPSDEIAEPIAMGRQTLWGGAGPPPSREVMDAAGRAARKEIANNMRDRRGQGRGSGSIEGGYGGNRNGYFRGDGDGHRGDNNGRRGGWRGRGRGRGY
eukprot:Tbor_TRINITY_DN716_c0_g1::TRINITY_DN716_c0_g1_i1::g.3390::m.3390/K11927/rhlE; ATP-dependent RNA helicase RhlE